LGDGHHTRKEQQHEGGCTILVLFTDGCGYGYGTEGGRPFPTFDEAEKAAERDRARIGVVDQMKMSSSQMSCIVVRPAVNGRWTVAIGIGSHTQHIRGSFSSSAAAESAGRLEVAKAWEGRLAYWQRLAAKAGIEYRCTAVPPTIQILRQEVGVSAWDYLAAA
jgi:hypothetical protein